MYKYINGKFELAVLCIKSELEMLDDTNGFDNICYINGVIYWDSDKSIPVRIDIDFKEQKTLGLPIKIPVKLMTADEYEKSEEKFNKLHERYNLSAEDILNNLNNNSINEDKKKEYLENVIIDEIGYKEAFRHFFPEASSILFGTED
jgi:hypothetical protein